MSVALMAAVYKNGPRELVPFSVLHTLADQVRDGSIGATEGACWPHLELIARNSRTSTRTALRTIAQLEREGWIRVERRAVRNSRRGQPRQGRLNCYYLSLARLGITSAVLSGAAPSPVQSSPVSLSYDAGSHDSVACGSPVDRGDFGGKPPKSGGNRCEKSQQKRPSGDALSGDSQCVPPHPLNGRTITQKQKQQQKPATASFSSLVPLAAARIPSRRPS